MAAGELSPGASFGPYLIEREIGRGGMSIVYRAIEPSLRRPVALKLMSPVLSSDEAFRKRFTAEAHGAAAITHPNVITVFAFGEQDGHLYIAMQWANSDDLRHLLDRSMLDVALAQSILSQTAAALDAVHRQGVIHRDIKPDNILLTDSGSIPGVPHVYVADFGIARALSAARMTQTGQVFGTVSYAAPEQLAGQAVDGRADVYSLACVAYEMLAGRPPFVRELPAAVIYAHLNERPSSVGQVRGDLQAAAVDAVLAGGLAKRPEDRYPTAGAFVEALGGALRDPGPVRAAEPTLRVQEPTDPFPRASVPASPVPGVHPPAQSASVPPSPLVSPSSYPAPMGMAAAAVVPGVHPPAQTGTERWIWRLHLRRAIGFALAFMTLRVFVLGPTILYRTDRGKISYYQLVAVAAIGGAAGWAWSVWRVRRKGAGRSLFELPVPIVFTLAGLAGMAQALDQPFWFVRRVPTLADPYVTSSFPFGTVFAALAAAVALRGVLVASLWLGPLRTGPRRVSKVATASGAMLVGAVLAFFGWPSSNAVGVVKAVTVVLAVGVLAAWVSALVYLRRARRASS